MQGAQEVGKSETKENGLGVHSVSNSTQRTGVDAVQGHQTKVSQFGKQKKPEKGSVTLEEIEERNIRAGSRTDGTQLVVGIVGSESIKRSKRTRNQELKDSVPELASRAASRAMAEAAKNISPLNRAYRKEVDLAIKYLENLTMVPRFDMLIMFLSPIDKAELLNVWDEVFCNEASPIECAEIPDNL